MSARDPWKRYLCMDLPQGCHAEKRARVDQCPAPDRTLELLAVLDRFATAIFQSIFVLSLQAEVDPKAPETEPSESEDVLDELSIKVASKVVNLVRRLSVWDIGLGAGS